MQAQLNPRNVGKLIKERFFFVRHGKTDWNDRNLCQGQTEIPLNYEGREEVKKLCPLIKRLPYSGIYVSPLKRALETARIIEQQSHGTLFLVLCDLMGISLVRQIPTAAVIECDYMNGRWLMKTYKIKNA